MILIDNESNVQFCQAPHFLIVFYLCSSKVKYSFLPEIIKRLQRVMPILPFVHVNSNEATGLSGGVDCGTSWRNQPHGKWEVEARGRRNINLY